jgi:hypothetical protein
MKSINHNSIAPLKPYTLVGFKPVSSVYVADVKSIAPRRQRPILNFTPRGKL